ncbi:SH3 domain-containing protein [Albimonas pacifica]|uniref:SH3 domain-containing protein n=1 Tax=Albimonas pacifica TaxID=1114924 RepID=A0A1I3JWF5_9RHOB|nr:SH3 domain-containing protein [Albimonas pacifica]SFI64609.1 SH3 domain-containing protein [Albimonas pacifica]
MLQPMTPLARRLSALALVALVPLAAAAQETPAPRGWLLVGPLPEGETLNLRAEPSGDAPVVGALPEGALVVSAGERAVSSVPWLRIAQGELQGWAAERFLRPAPIRTLDDASFPVAGACGGFEPMWSLRWTEIEITYERLGEPAASRPVTRAIPAEGRLSALLEAGADPAERWLFRYEDEQCFEMPLDAPVWGRGTLVITEGGTTRWLTGCCRPAPEAIGAP